MPARTSTWRDVLVVATALTLASPALVLAASAPLPALAVVALGAVAVRTTRTPQRRAVLVARRSWGTAKRVLGRATEP